MFWKKSQRTRIYLLHYFINIIQHTPTKMKLDIFITEIIYTEKAPQKDWLNVYGKLSTRHNRI